MTKELNAKIELLESEITDLKQKVNEIVSCLEDNKISRKVSIDYLYQEETEDEVDTLDEEATEEEAEETPED